MKPFNRETFHLPAEGLPVRMWAMRMTCEVPALLKVKREPMRNRGTRHEARLLLA
jgi:hypothetical protein